MSKKDETDHRRDIRRQAEELFYNRAKSRKQTDEDSKRLLFELEVHQIELEIQNEELRRSRTEAEELRDKYLDLFDFAPVSYIVVDISGTIREINLAGAQMLGTN